MRWKYRCVLDIQSKKLKRGSDNCNVVFATISCEHEIISLVLRFTLIRRSESPAALIFLVGRTITGFAYQNVAGEVGLKTKPTVQSIYRLS